MNLLSKKAQVDIYGNGKMYGFYSCPKHTFIEGYEGHDRIGGVNGKKSR